MSYKWVLINVKKLKKNFFLHNYKKVSKQGEFEYTKLSNALLNGDFKTASKYLPKEDCIFQLEKNILKRQLLKI